ncbi:hypothetical protein [Thermococcus camini]|uniref:Membrane-bound dolichyl-phosphate-mannose-protein mannosyltransferase n=1 Tax=Thermococcus camini TaxID=2016373 RepID=A0A7G2DA81_9EURY|nr:hypothetical protein [Thermococcus camini]CAD5243898.1 conserved membrane protein of unknown function [Thermococcus camini]
MRHPERALALILLVGLTVRLALAPYSAGSDLAQFYGFAGTMLEKKACFYAYADWIGYSGKGWPYPWPYVYGPVLAYLLAVIRLLVGGSVEAFWSGGVYHVYVDPTWAFAVKLVFIAADTAVALLIYALLRERGTWESVVGSALYYLNPMVIHVSAVYGMFDAVPLAVFLLGLHLRNRENISPAFQGLSLAIKHTLLFPAVVSLWEYLLGGVGGLKKAALLFAGAAVPFLPMLLLCPSSLRTLPRLMRGIEVGYPLPLSYSMNGFVSLLTYFHEAHGVETLIFIEHWYVPAGILLFLTLVRHSFERNPVVSASLAYATFTASYWRVNPQYLLPLVSFLILVAFNTRGNVRLISLFTAFYIGIWPILQPSEFWFHVHLRNPNWAVVRFMGHFTIGVWGDVPYVAYSLVLSILLYALLLGSTLPYLKNLKAWLSEKSGVRA